MRTTCPRDADFIHNLHRRSLTTVLPTHAVARIARAVKSRLVPGSGITTSHRLHFAAVSLPRIGAPKGSLSLGANFDLDQIVQHQVRGRSCKPWELGSGIWLLAMPTHPSIHPSISLPPLQHSFARTAVLRRRLTVCRVDVRVLLQKRRSSLETALRVLGRKTPGPSNARSRAILANWIRCRVFIGRCA